VRRGEGSIRVPRHARGVWICGAPELRQFAAAGQRAVCAAGGWRDGELLPGDGAEGAEVPGICGCYAGFAEMARDAHAFRGRESFQRTDDAIEYARGDSGAL